MILTKEDLIYFAEEGIRDSISKRTHSKQIGKNNDIEDIICPNELTQIYIKLKNGRIFVVEVKDFNEQQYNPFD